MTRYVVGDRQTGKTRAVVRWLLAGEVIGSGAKARWSRMVIVVDRVARMAVMHELRLESGTRVGAIQINPSTVEMVKQVVTIQELADGRLRGRNMNGVEAAIDGAGDVLQRLLFINFRFDAPVDLMTLDSESVTVLGDRTHVRPSHHGAST